MSSSKTIAGAVDAVTVPVDGVRIKYDPDKPPVTFLRTDRDKVFTFEEGGQYPATWSFRAGKVRLADGSEHNAVLQFCDSDSGEHYGTAIWVEDGLAWQDEDDFLPRLGKTKEEVYPYSYKYAGTMERDHHTGADGWSR